MLSELGSGILFTDHAVSYNTKIILKALVTIAVVAILAVLFITPVREFFGDLFANRTVTGGSVTGYPATTP
jgi:hypothetical protein